MKYATRRPRTRWRDSRFFFFPPPSTQREHHARAMDNSAKRRRTEDSSVVEFTHVTGFDDMTVSREWRETVFWFVLHWLENRDVKSMKLVCWTSLFASRRDLSSITILATGLRMPKPILPFKSVRHIKFICEGRCHGYSVPSFLKLVSPVTEIPPWISTVFPSTETVTLKMGSSNIWLPKFFESLAGFKGKVTKFKGTASMFNAAASAIPREEWNKLEHVSLLPIEAAETSMFQRILEVLNTHRPKKMTIRLADHWRYVPREYPNQLVIKSSFHQILTLALMTKFHYPDDVAYSIQPGKVTNASPTSLWDAYNRLNLYDNGNHSDAKISVLPRFIRHLDKVRPDTIRDADIYRSTYTTMSPGLVISLLVGGLIAVYAFGNPKAPPGWLSSEEWKKFKKAACNIAFANQTALEWALQTFLIDDPKFLRVCKIIYALQEIARTVGGPPDSEKGKHAQAEIVSVARRIFGHRRTPKRIGFHRHHDTRMFYSIAECYPLWREYFKHVDFPRHHFECVPIEEEFVELLGAPGDYIIQKGIGNEYRQRITFLSSRRLNPEDRQGVNAHFRTLSTHSIYILNREALGSMGELLAAACVADLHNGVALAKTLLLDEYDYDEPSSFRYIYHSKHNSVPAPAAIAILEERRTFLRVLQQTITLLRDSNNSFVRYMCRIYEDVISNTAKSCHGILQEILLGKGEIISNEKGCVCIK